MHSYSEYSIIARREKLLYVYCVYGVALTVPQNFFDSALFIQTVSSVKGTDFG